MCSKGIRPESPSSNSTLISVLSTAGLGLAVCRQKKIHMTKPFLYLDFYTRFAETYEITVSRAHITFRRSSSAFVPNHLPNSSQKLDWFGLLNTELGPK